MLTKQLEIGFERCPKPVDRRQRRMTRAAWWFRRMHKAVNQALEWDPAPTPRPEQIYLALAKSR
jgi:hypothetical protein